MKPDYNESCLFTWREGNNFLNLILYVDDILLASNDREKMQELKQNLNRSFEMTDIGEPKSFLVLEIKRDRKARVLKITQEKYILKMITEFEFKDMNPQRTPMATNQVASRQRREREESESIDTLLTIENNKNMPSRETIGTLLYLTNTCRPDIAYAVNVLSRHQINPTDSDWRGVKRVFRYLKGTQTVGLTYLGKSDIFEGFSDVSFGDCKGSLTTSGYVIKLFGDAIAWRTRRQRYIALSTCQAEYVSMRDCSQELISIRNTLKDVLSREFTPITLWCDNRSAESNVKTGIGNKLRHMTDIKEHCVKECVKRQLVYVRWILARLIINK